MISWIQLLSLAFVNSINPCALAALVMVLISVLLGNEDKRHKVLLGGFAFIAAVFIGYLFYGIIIVQLFKSFASLMSMISPYIRYALAFFAIILGIMNIKDYIRYKPGGLGTEMPLKYRPRVRMLLKNISSPKGAFLSGIFVTLFLLPCTMGPYIIFSGGLADVGLITAISYLLLYNLIFIIPMLAITITVYFGISSAEKVSEWRDRNIKIIHLIAGLVLLGLGIAMITGLI